MAFGVTAACSGSAHPQRRKLRCPGASRFWPAWPMEPGRHLAASCNDPLPDLTARGTADAAHELFSASIPNSEDLLACGEWQAEGNADRRAAYMHRSAAIQSPCAGARGDCLGPTDSLSLRQPESSARLRGPGSRARECTAQLRSTNDDTIYGWLVQRFPIHAAPWPLLSGMCLSEPAMGVFLMRRRMSLQAIHVARHPPGAAIAIVAACRVGGHDLAVGRGVWWSCYRRGPAAQEW
jgi:hypothetical protein